MCLAPVAEEGSCGARKQERVWCAVRGSLLELGGGAWHAGDGAGERGEVEDGEEVTDEGSAVLARKIQLRLPRAERRVVARGHARLEEARRGLKRQQPREHLEGLGLGQRGRQAVDGQRRALLLLHNVRHSLARKVRHQRRPL